MKKRTITPFSLSFIDIIFCGFGAVVLLVMILNGEVLRKREARSEDLRGELARVTKLEDFAKSYLAEIESQVDAVELEEGELESRVMALRKQILGTRADISQAKEQERAQRQATEKLELEKKTLETTAQLLKSKETPQVEPGKRLIGFTGDGRRQYLTGLKLGGERTLILLDSSASMLDETVVNIVRRKLMNADIRRRAPKWQRTLRTLHWLVANLKQQAQFQVVSFNTVARAVVADSDGRWLDAGNVKHLEAVLSAARKIAPEKGTSLHNAFRTVSYFKPRPDSIILLTDGLPTQAHAPSGSSLVTGRERMELFESASQMLPKTLPVNTLLFPMEGDPTAAAAFWKLAIRTKGSFITPSRDWP